MRDADDEDTIFMKRDPKWVVNPRLMRWMGYVFAFHADKRKARVAEIVLELDIAKAIYNYASGDFKEQVVKEYAGPYEPEKRDERKEKLRSNLGFYLWLRGEDVQGACGRKWIHGPPLSQEEFRSSLQNLVESFRQSRIEDRQTGASETEVAVFLWPAVLEILLGGTFAFQTGKIPPT